MGPNPRARRVGDPRHDFEETVPHVEYALSETGLELLVRMVPLWTWIVENADSFRAARAAFDRTHGTDKT